MTSPAFQFYPSDWLSSPRIALMTPAQEGAYIRLLCYDWEKDGIPDNREKLAILGRIDGTAIAEVLLCFMAHPSKPGFLTNERLQIERQRQAYWHKIKSEGGKKGAVKRWKPIRSKGKWDTHDSANGRTVADDALPPSSSHSSPPNVPPIPPKGDCVGSFHRDTRTALHLLNEFSGSHYREVDANLRFISARLSEPEVTLDGVRTMLARQVKLWKGTSMEQYLRPATLFNATKFQSYYASRDAAVFKEVNGHQVKPEVQLRSLDDEISRHPANRESVNYQDNCTQQQRDDLKALRTKRAALNSQLARV